MTDRLAYGVCNRNVISLCFPYLGINIDMKNFCYVVQHFILMPAVSQQKQRVSVNQHPENEHKAFRIDFFMVLDLESAIVHLLSQLLPTCMTAMRASTELCCETVAGWRNILSLVGVF